MIITLFLNCTNTDTNKLEKLIIINNDYMYNSAIGFDCKRFNESTSLYKSSISNTSKLSYFYQHYIKLKQGSSSENFKTYIKVYVYFKNKTVDTICFGSSVGRKGDFIINGRSYKYNEKLSNFIKKEIDFYNLKTFSKEDEKYKGVIKGLIKRGELNSKGKYK